MKPKQTRRCMPMLPPSIEGYVLAKYDCLDDSAPLEPIDSQLQSLADALAFARHYNQRAANHPRLTKLVGLFPLGIFR